MILEVRLCVQALKEADGDFNHIKPDFIVGINSNPLHDTREGGLVKKWNEDCVKR